MQVEYAMLALGADHSANGLLHVFSGGFDSITVDNLPGMLPPFWIVVRINEENLTTEETHEFSLIGINPDGERRELMRSPQAFKFPPAASPGDMSKSTVIVQVFFNASIPGKHQFAICVDGIEVNRLNLKVNVREVASAEGS